MTAMDVRTGYLFHGDELFPARQFIEGIKKELVTGEGEPAAEEKFDLDETGWRDIIDRARNMPFFFSPWRIFVIEAGKPAHEDLDAPEQAVLKEFLAAPPPKTVLVVLFQGRIQRTKPLFKLFDGQPETAVEVREMKPLRGDRLKAWAEGKAAELNKRFGPGALDRLLEIVGDDLRVLDGELEKLATYAGERKTIERNDVQAVSDWVKTFENWDLTDALEAGDTRQALVVLGRYLAEGVPAVSIVNSLAGLFRDFLLARTGLEAGRDRREIFKEIRPRIQQNWGTFYNAKLRAFFGAVERIPAAAADRLLEDLEGLDLKLKSTEADEQTLLTAFFYDFGRAGRREGSTSRSRDSGPGPGG